MCLSILSSTTIRVRRVICVWVLLFSRTSCYIDLIIFICLTGVFYQFHLILEVAQPCTFKMRTTRLPSAPGALMLLWWCLFVPVLALKLKVGHTDTWTSYAFHPTGYHDDDGSYRKYWWDYTGGRWAAWEITKSRMRDNSTRPWQYNEKGLNIVWSSEDSPNLTYEQWRAVLNFHPDYDYAFEDSYRIFELWLQAKAREYTW